MSTRTSITARSAALTMALALTLGCTAPSPPTPSAPWQPLFDGQSLNGFAVTDFGGQGEVAVHDGALHLGIGSPLTGVTWTGPFADGGENYELEITAARCIGNDFFVGLTFPVGSEFATLVLGGWGGSVCGLSSLDGRDAANNATRTTRSFVKGRDYTVLVTVAADRVTASLDGEPLCSAPRGAVRFGLRPEVLLSRPLGLASFATETAMRTLRWRRLPGN